MKYYLIAVLAVLFFTLGITAQAQAFTSSEDRFYQNIVRSQGWKCNEVVRTVSGGRAYHGRAVEIQCTNGVLGRSVYHYMIIAAGGDKRSVSICWKGKCRKIN